MNTMLAIDAFVGYEEIMQVRVDDTDIWHRPGAAELAMTHTACGVRYPDLLRGNRPTERNGMLCPSCYTEFEINKTAL